MASDYMNPIKNITLVQISRNTSNIVQYLDGSLHYPCRSRFILLLRQGWADICDINICSYHESGAVCQNILLIIDKFTLYLISQLLST